VMVAAILGGAAGPWVTGVLYDRLGSYSPAFCLAAGCNLISILAIWRAAPGKVRAVAGRTGLSPTRSSPPPDCTRDRRGD
jgi:fucose permease